MRKAILGAISILALASPAVAADLPVTPYSEVPSYEYRTVAACRCRGAGNRRGSPTYRYSAAASGS